MVVRRFGRYLNVYRFGVADGAELTQQLSADFRGGVSKGKKNGVVKTRTRNCYYKRQYSLSLPQSRLKGKSKQENQLPTAKGDFS